MINDYYSPLRYPGGKACLSDFLAEIIILNKANGGTYYELYAGGAGAALSLLFNEVVNKIVINDADRRIYAFWYAVLNNKSKFFKLIDETDVSIEEWHKQKEIYENADNETLLKVGFATFFLNRTNRSGIIHKAGPIGGLQQNGNYLIDVRFNKVALKERIQNIYNYRDQIQVLNLTTEEFLLNESLYKKGLSKSLFYLDPPYYYKGQELYLNNYVHDQHKNLSDIIKMSKIKNWLISYDNVIEIRKMYPEYRKSQFGLNYSLHEKREGSELVIFSNSLKVPNSITIRNKVSKLQLR
jgi:DNA adenine methylase